MQPTAACLSKASRRALTPKRGNKDFYKGTRQAYLPGGLRTGPPGKHVIGGRSKYRLVDEQVRIFIAPPLERIVNSPLKPYVSLAVKLTSSSRKNVYYNTPMPTGGFTPDHFYATAPRTGRARERLGAVTSLQAYWEQGLAKEGDEDQ